MGQSRVVCRPEGARAVILWNKMTPVNTQSKRANRKRFMRTPCTRRTITGAIFGVALTVIGAGPVGWAVAAEAKGPPHPPLQWRVSGTVNYSSGSDRTDTRTNTLSVPVTV